MSRQTPQKEEVLRLLESCGSPGAKLAVGLAAFSGLKPGVLRGLVLRNLVELSQPGLQFSQVPSRIEVVVGRRGATLVRFYTFLSTDGCQWLLEDLKTRSQFASAKSPVVTAQSFREAEKTVHTAGLKWFDLRRYCMSAFMVADTKLPRDVIDSMFGYKVKEDALQHFVNFFKPSFISFVRQEYVRVEGRFFV